MDTPLKSLAVANRFIELAKDAGATVTPMKLLKLIYFAHGWHLAITDGKRPLIDEQIEAWKFGPVAPSVYHAFKGYESSPITSLGQELDMKALTERDEVIFQTPIFPRSEPDDAFMSKIWSIYGPLSAFQLSELTHQSGTPWHKVWYEMGGAQRKHTDIPDPLITEYFKAKLAA